MVRISCSCGETHFEVSSNVFKCSNTLDSVWISSIYGLQELIIPIDVDIIFSCSIPMICSLFQYVIRFLVAQRLNKNLPGVGNHVV